MLRLERVLQKQQEDDDFQQAFHALETSKAELEYWESLTFSFDHSDMAKNDPNGPPHPHQWPSSAASPSAAAQVMDLLPFSRQTSQAFFQPVVPDLITLARLAASAGLLQGPVTEEHLSMLVNTLQHTVANAERPLQPPVYPQIHPQSQPYTNQAPQMQSLRRTTLETRPVLPGRRQSQQYFDQGWERSSGIHTPISSVPPLTPGHNFPQTYAYEFGRNNQPIPGNEDARIRAPSDAVASSSGYTLDQASTGVDEDDDDGSVNAEDKRSRNTAASGLLHQKLTPIRICSLIILIRSTIPGQEKIAHTGFGEIRDRVDQSRGSSGTRGFRIARRKSLPQGACDAQNSRNNSSARTSRCQRVRF